MHKEILNKTQLALLPIVESFSNRGFYLAGGTALSLQLGHRESIDFDLFTEKEFKNTEIIKILKENFEQDQMQVLIDVLDEYTLLINDTKVTFLRYPFQIKDIEKEEGINIADALTIGAMKAYAIGRRSKWKDYVDIYTLLQKYSLEDILNKTSEIFGSLFSSKMFLQQLAYFKDIDYTEEVIWRIENPPSMEAIQKYLVNISVEYLGKPSTRSLAS